MPLSVIATFTTVLLVTVIVALALPSAPGAPTNASAALTINPDAFRVRVWSAKINSTS